MAPLRVLSLMGLATTAYGFFQMHSAQPRPTRAASIMMGGRTATPLGRTSTVAGKKVGRGRMMYSVAVVQSSVCLDHTVHHTPSSYILPADVCIKLRPSCTLPATACIALPLPATVHHCSLFLPSGLRWMKDHIQQYSSSSFFLYHSRRPFITLAST